MTKEGGIAGFSIQLCLVLIDKYSKTELRN